MQKEQFSKAYVRALASVVGLSMNDHTVDDDSVDCTFCLKGGGEKVRSPKLDVQLKCTERHVIGEKSISYQLSRKNYDDLRDKDVMVPRILVVMVVPNDLNDWLVAGKEETLIRKCAWWISLRGYADRADVKQPTIQIPIDQFFNPEQLRIIMERIGRGESL